MGQGGRFHRIVRGWRAMNVAFPRFRSGVARLLLLLIKKTHIMHIHPLV